MTIGLVTGAVRPTGPSIDQDKIQRSVATVFAHLYRLQAGQLHRPDVPESALGAAAACTKGDGLVAQNGPGNDWRCGVVWHIPGVATVLGSAVYQLDVSADERYAADGDGPKEVNGYFVVHTITGDEPNPLWQLDGNVNLFPNHCRKQDDPNSRAYILGSGVAGCKTPERGRSG